MCNFAPQKAEYHFMNYQTHICRNGLRIIHLPSQSSVIYCGFAVKAGTRHEKTGEEGLAHFCEHLAFKGTRRRSAVQIINALEGVGGELNAFTNKEETVYYAATTRQHFLRAVDVLSDIVFCSQYPEHEVEKEREVVCDEIESYEDSPSELIFDEFENLLFEGHPLGHNILGTSERVRQYTSADARRFTNHYYRFDNSIFFVSGDIDFRMLVKTLEGMEPVYDVMDVTSSSATKGLLKPFVASEPVIRHRDTHQAHVMIGTRAFSFTDERRWPLYLLNNIMGGPAMNSRLNLSLRERNGLVYTVESTMASYSDTGAWSVYFGCDQHDVKRCCRMVGRELDRLCQHPLSDTQLRKAKQQMRGQLAIASDNREQFALDFAKNYLHHGTERNLDEIIAHLETVTASQLQQVACEVFAPEKLLTLIYD
jgi:predicted Zn-dependent peptidase